MEKPLPLPFINPPGRPWLPSMEKPGEWHAWDTAGIKGWTLKCLPVFKAEIRYVKHRRVYMLDLNDVAMGEHKDLAPLQVRAEREMIARVRGMLPAYRVIHARAAARCQPAVI